MQPVLPDRPIEVPSQHLYASKDILVPGARDKRQPIIPNITKHVRKHSQDPAKPVLSGVQTGAPGAVTQFIAS